MNNNSILWKNFFCPKNRGNGPKIGFWEFKEKFAHWLSLYLFYIENFYLLHFCANPLGKIKFQRYRPRSSQPSNCIAGFLNELFLLSKLMKQSIFSMLIWPIWSLDSKIELTNGISLFFAYWCSFMKINLKVLWLGIIKKGCGQSCYWILKLTASGEWTDGINWFFACWYRFTKIKWNPNFQDILNWILQILYYYCRKYTTQKYQKLTDYWTLVFSFHFSLFTATCAFCRLPQRQNFFISWTKYFANFKCHKWSFVQHIVSFSGLKMIFTKFSQLDITVCIEKCVYNNCNFRCYFMSSIIERLQISFL